MAGKAKELKLYIEKKKNERYEKCKLDILEKKKLAEERKKKLDHLKQTTRELAKASNKQKTIHVQDKCKIGINLPTESNETKVDQTWLPLSKVKHVRKPIEAPRNVQKISINLPIESNESKVDQTWSPPPPKIKSFKKPLEALKNVQKKAIKGFEITDECSNDTKDIISTCTSTKISTEPNTMSTTKLIDPKPQIRDVTKPENLFSQFKFNDDFKLLFGKNFFDSPMPKLIDSDTSSIQKDNNDSVTLLNGLCLDNKKQLTMPGINLSINPSDTINNSTKLQTRLQLPVRSHKEIMKSIDNLEELQELLFDKCLPVKNCLSKSTQTENFNNILSLRDTKSPPPSMSFISVLKCKLNLQRLQQLNESKIISQNEATSPISIGTNIFNQVQNVEVQTDVQTNSEQSDLDTQIILLKKQIEVLKLESVKLKKEQKELELKNLKAKEHDVLKQINLCDKKIEESRKSLMKKNIKNMIVSKSSTKNDSSPSTNSNCSNTRCYNTCSSNSSALQRNLIVNLNENDTDECEMQKNSVSQFEEPN